jgi:hypothetical protein
MQHPIGLNEHVGENHSTSSTQPSHRLHIRVLSSRVPLIFRVDNVMLQQPGGASAQPFLTAQARAPAPHTLTVRAVVTGAADPAQPADEVPEQEEPLL